MKKLLILLVVIILAGCASNAPTVEIPTNTPEPTEPKITVYEVNHDTGLYKDNNADSEQLAVLRIGHRLTPANGQSTPQCESIDAGGGMTIHLCYMTSLETDESGWVISKWLTKVE